MMGFFFSLREQHAFRVVIFVTVHPCQSIQYKRLKYIDISALDMK